MGSGSSGCRQALEAAKGLAASIYQVAQIDGTEISVNLPNDASARDLYLAVAAQRGLPVYQLKLVVKGHKAPLPSNDVKVADAVAGERDLLLVVSDGISLGWGLTEDRCALEHSAFQHYSVPAFGLCPGRKMLELCQGKMLRGLDKESAFDDPLGIQNPYGVIFNRSAEVGSSAEPLFGRVLIRILVHRRVSALGIGLGTAEVDVSKDPEHDAGFFGMYHGGHSANCCAGGSRYFRARKQREWQQQMLAILVDAEQNTMQCFEDLQPFGPLRDLPPKPLWPVVILWSPEDSVSISITSI
ncbi:unnamed protein product [Effrenium voratum]|nr:unnamed protein product [Effrenium voratum]